MPTKKKSKKRFQVSAEGLDLATKYMEDSFGGAESGPILIDDLIPILEAEGIEATLDAVVDLVTAAASLAIVRLVLEKGATAAGTVALFLIKLMASAAVAEH